MARTGSLLLLTSLALVVAACGPEAPPVMAPRPPAPPAPKPPPPPEPARWSFDDESAMDVAAKLDLGAAGTLFVGRAGRRAIEPKPGDPLKNATLLANDDLVGVMKDAQGRFLFVAADGDVHVAKEPLGVIETTRRGPLSMPEGASAAPRFADVATGKSAIVGVRDGVVHRSTDGGEKWSQVDYQGAAKIVGQAAQVAMDDKGRGLLLVFPQKLYVTVDDGATWAPIASPGIGAVRIARGGDGFVWLKGPSKGARLEGEPPKFVAASSTVPPIYVPKEKDEVESWKIRRARSVLFGDRFARARDVSVDDGRKVEITVGKLGEAGKTHKVVADEGFFLSDHALAGHGNDLYLLRGDAEEDQTRLLHSADGGVTWAVETTFEGARASYDDPRMIAAGPKGWAYVGSICPSEGWGTKDCHHRKVRPAGAKAFEDLAFSEPFIPREFAFDVAHGRVYAFGTIVGESKSTVFQSRLDENKFLPTKLKVDEHPYRYSVTVDDKGTVRLLHPKGGEWELLRLSAEGELLPRLYVKLDATQVDLAGLHGFAIDNANRGWETADGGETWVRVGSFPSSDFECAQTGCVLAGAQRVGWDLPALVSAEKIVASETAAPKVKWTPPAEVKEPSEKIQCRTEGKWTPVASYGLGFETVDAHPSGSRWAVAREDGDSRVVIVVASKGGVLKEQVLLPAPAKPVKGKEIPGLTITTPRTITTAAGVVAARYSYVRKSKGSGDYSPVDIDIAWWSAKTGKVVRHQIPAAKPFRIGRFGLGALVEIVDGGLFFQANASAAWNPLFLEDSGKRQELGAVDRRWWGATALRYGTRWLLASDEYGQLSLSQSDDGKSWLRRTWGVSDQSSSSTIGLLGGKPFLLSQPWRDRPSFLLALDGAGDDPPPAVAAEVFGKTAVCDGKTAGLRHAVPIGNAGRTFELLVDDLPKGLVATKGALHYAQSGTPCVAAYEMRPWAPYMSSYGSATEGGALVFPDPVKPKVFTGWTFQKNTEKKGPDIAARPIVCGPDVKPPIKKDEPKKPAKTGPKL